MKLVSDFYRDLPFNYTETPELYVNNIKDVNQVLEYQDLDHLLLRISKNYQHYKYPVFEMGCGTGWLSNSINYHYHLNVSAIDFTEKALLMAKSVTGSLGLDNKFEAADIFDYQTDDKFPVVVSLGVLHHTKDCKAAFAKAASLVTPGGHLYVGLYHKYSRLPMLQLMRSHAFWHGEDFAYDLFRGMSHDHSDRQLGLSWFRDQVLHPHETQHTIEEVFCWADELNLAIESTSINKYKPLNGSNFRETLIATEKELYNYSYNQNVRNLCFLPGYFTVLLHKPVIN